MQQYHRLNYSKWLCLKAGQARNNLPITRPDPKVVLPARCHPGINMNIYHRTPKDGIYEFSTHVKLRDLLCEVANKNCILMGDFNYRCIDWSQGLSTNDAKVDSKLFLECVEDCYVTQHANC
jgi:hypothetical protein